MRDLDELLRAVIREAEAAGIPVGRHISEKLIINPRPKKRLGACRKSGRSRYEIELSGFMAEAEEKEIKTVLAHEILHTCAGCMNHGDRWKKYVAVMNERYGYKISRTTDLKGLGGHGGDRASDEDYRYRIECESCGRTVYRRRKSKVVQNPGRYRCRCGGRLRVEEL